MTQPLCVCCGQAPSRLLATYCSIGCALEQLAVLRMLLNTTPRRALSVAEWHDLGQSFETEVELCAIRLSSTARPTHGLRD